MMDGKSSILPLTILTKKKKIELACRRRSLPNIPKHNMQSMVIHKQEIISIKHGLNLPEFACKKGRKYAGQKSWCLLSPTNASSISYLIITGINFRMESRSLVVESGKFQGWKNVQPVHRPANGIRQSSGEAYIYFQPPSTLFSLATLPETDFHG